MIAPITTLFLLSTVAIVFLSIFILSTPLNCLIFPKNSQKLTTEKNNCEKTLANENRLLNVFTQAEENKRLMLEKDNKDEEEIALFNANNNNSNSFFKTLSAVNNSGVNNSHSCSEIPRYTN